MATVKLSHRKSDKHLPSSVSMTPQKTMAAGFAPGEKQGAVWEEQV